MVPKVPKNDCKKFVRNVVNIHLGWNSQKTAYTFLTIFCKERGALNKKSNLKVLVALAITHLKPDEGSS